MTKQQSKWKYRLFASLFLLLVPLLAIGLEQPFVIIFFILSISLLIFAFTESGVSRVLLVGCLIITTALGFADIYLNQSVPDCETTNLYRFLSNSNHPNGTEWNFLIPDSVLGYKAIPDVRVLSIKNCSKKTVYRVTYTFNHGGQRQTPHTAQVRSADGLVFGDSFALGQGLQDDETLASYLEKESGYRYHVHNLGLFGYGPHQTLAILQNQLERVALKDKHPKFGINFSVFDPSRSAGHANWMKNGPHYEIGKNENLRYVGLFGNDPKFHLIRILDKSPVFRNTLLPAIHRKEDTTLFISLLMESSRLFQSRYNTNYFVFLWPTHHPDYNYAVQKLKANGVYVITPSQIFRNYQKRWREYVIRQDGHPNATANREAAQYFLCHISGTATLKLD